MLTGIHLGAYGLDLLPCSSLEKLLERLEVEETPDRVRLSSIEPLDFSPEIISLLSRSSKVCPHLHIPIQSGDDEILKRMERNYDPAFLSDLVWELYGRIPDLSIGADVIVGFPGETEEKFERTYRWVESHPLSYLHVFPFSKRKGTAASEFSQEVNREIIKERAERLRALGKQKRDSFYRRFLHRELAVLVEDRREKESGRWKGFSRNYIPVLLSRKEAARGRSGLGEPGMEGEGERIDRKGVGRGGDREADVSEEEMATLEELESRLGYRFNEIEWLKNALTHKSFTHQSSLPPTDPSARAANEVLEFLGDAVLNLAVSHLLLLEFPDAQEGALSKKRAHLVKQSFLAFLSKELRLERHLLLGKGELLNGGRKKSSILANTYEALVGAIYMDSGFRDLAGAEPRRPR